MKCHKLWHIIWVFTVWVFTVCQSTCLSFYGLQRMNIKEIFRERTYNKVRMVYYTYSVITCNITISKSIAFFQFIANSADLDETPQYVAFHLGLHCLSKFTFEGFWSTKIKYQRNILRKISGFIK